MFFVTTVSSSLPPIQPLKLDGYKLDLDQYLRRAYDDVSEASAELPAIMEWLGEQLQIMREELNSVSQSLDQARAKAFHRLGTEDGWNDAGYSGKRTVEAIKFAIDLDSEVITLTKSHGTLSAWCERLKGTQRNFTSKLELVRSSEATRRKIHEVAEPHEEAIQD